MEQRRTKSLVAAAIIGTMTFGTMACGDSKDGKEKLADTPELTVRPASNVETVGTTGGSPAVETGPVSFEEAKKTFDGGDFHEASRMFKGFTTTKPDNMWGHYMLGLSAWKEHDFEQAETELLRSIEIDSTHLKSRYNLARVYLDNGEPEKAVDQIRVGLTLDSTSSEGYRLLGRSQDQLGQLPEGEQSYRIALKLDQQDAWTMNNLGLNLIQQNRPEEAIGVLARAVQLKPDNARFENNLGMALELNGYVVKAGEEYEKAVALDGSNQKAQQNLDRVKGHSDKPGIPELKLEEVAQRFAGELEGEKVSESQ